MSFHYSTSPPMAAYGHSGSQRAVSSNGTQPPAALSPPAGASGAYSHHPGRAMSYQMRNYSRSSSTSPPFANAFPAIGSSYLNASVSSKSRFNATRGFELEDDMEFCPALSSDRSSNVSSASSDTSDYYTPDQAPAPAYGSKSLMSPLSSPSHGGHAVLMSPTAESPRNPGVSRVRRAIEIVDPTTGQRVGSASPSPTKH